MWAPWHLGTGEAVSDGTGRAHEPDCYVLPPALLGLVVSVDLEAEHLCQVVAVGALEAVPLSCLPGVVVSTPASALASALSIVYLVDHALVHVTASLVLLDHSNLPTDVMAGEDGVHIVGYSPHQLDQLLAPSKSSLTQSMSLGWILVIQMKKTDSVNLGGLDPRWAGQLTTCQQRGQEGSQHFVPSHSLKMDSNQKIEIKTRSPPGNKLLTC